MKSSNFSQETDYAIRTAKWVSRAPIIPALGIMLIYLWLGWQQSNWLLLFVGILTGLIGLVGYFNNFFIKQGRLYLGIRLLILSIIVDVLVSIFAIQGLGPTFALAIFIFPSVIAMLTLTPRDITLVSVLGVLLGAFVFFVDTFQPTARFTLPVVITNVLNITTFCVAFFYVLGIVRNFNHFALRIKFTVVFLSVAVVPLIILAILNNRVIREQLTDNASTILLASAKTTAGDLNTFIESNLNAIRTEAKLPPLINYLETPQTEPNIRNLKSETTTVLRALSLKDNVYVSSYALLDIDGEVLIDTYGTAQGENKADQEFFLTPVQTGLPYVSAIEIAQIPSEETGFYFSAPVRNIDNIIIGVLAMRYRASILQRVVTNSGGLAGNGSYAILLDENHIRLADGLRPDLVFTSVVPLSPTKVVELQTSRLLPPGTPLELSTNLPEFEAGLNQYENQPIFFASIEEGIASIESLAVVQLDFQPWLIAYIQPQEVFLAPILAQTRNTAFVSIGISTLVALVAFGFTQLLATPIIRVTNVAQLVSSGDLSARVGLETQDEIGKLAKAFDDMTERLANLIDSLEQRVTERTLELQTANQLLAHEKDLLQVLLDNIPDTIYYKDTKSRFTRINLSQAKVLGIADPNEAVGKTDLDFQDPQLAQAFLQEEQELMQTGEPIVDRVEFNPTRAGEPRWFSATKAPIHDHNSRITGLVGVSRDITERKLAEEKLAHAADELRRSNAELEQFAYVASHDLQEPLRMVSSYTQLLARKYKGKLGEDADEYIAFAVDGAKRMQTLIQDLLSFSRVGSQGKPFQLVNLDKTASQVLTDLQMIISETNVLIVRDPLPKVFGDDVQLAQLLLNLIGNALKYRSEASPQIHISAIPQENNWLISIKDNGIGFDMRYKERIFIIFQRLHDRNQYSGTGIGLALCRKIVERHGGKIWVESQPGVGSNFFFTLPSIEEKL